MQHRRNRHHASQRRHARVAAGRHAQHEIAAQREAHQPRRGGQLRPQRRHRAADLGQPAGMEQALVQVVRGAVVAQVQAHHLHASGMQVRGQRQHVVGIRAAFPAVQQDGGLADGLFRPRVEGLQPHAIAAIQDQLAAGGQQLRRATPQAGGVAARLGRMDWKWRLPQGHRGANSPLCGESSPHAQYAHHVATSRLPALVAPANTTTATSAARAGW